MHLVILEVLSNPLLGHSGDLTADLSPVVGNLTPRFVNSPVSLPNPGHEIDSANSVLKIYIKVHFVYPRIPSIQPLILT